MSLRSEIREMYRRGWPDRAVLIELTGTAAPATIRSAMSKVRRRELGIVLRPDRCGPRRKLKKKTAVRR